MNLKHLILLPLPLLSVACSAVPTASEPTSNVETKHAAEPMFTQLQPIEISESVDTVKTLEKEQPQTEMIDYARRFLGTQYIYGGSTPKGFDCSGYIQYVYRKFDINIPRTTAAYPSLYANKVSLEDAKVGDLIVFTGTNPNIRKPGHAGIITEIGDGKLSFIHSSSSKKHFGVTETNYYKSGYPRRFLTVVSM